MTYLVLVRHGESIWHALWTKEPVLLWTISADGCRGPAPGGYRRSERGGHHGRGRCAGRGSGSSARPVLSAQRSP